jgi:CRISPR-associated protein Csx14
MSTKFKEIFIFIAGSTPQVITETIYALATKKPSIQPDEIHIITTQKGKEIAKHSLIDKGILKKLFSEYSLADVPLTEDSFHIPRDKSGKPLEDIKNESENELMGDLITSFIREKTKDTSNRLHCSIAGGRKTMSFYLGAALQLFGRQWDKLYHVLVRPEFESNPDFFYKPPKDRTIKCNGRQLNTKNACISLAELPFIRLRSKLSLDGKGFSELVREGQREIDIAFIQPEIKVALSERSVYIGQNMIKFTPVQLMIYTAYLRQKMKNCKYPERQYCLDCTECFPSLLEMTTKPALEEMAKDYMLICPAKVDDLLYKYKTGFSIEVIRQAICKIKNLISEALRDEALIPYYAITTSLRGYANTRHGVRVEKGKIKIE